jgi:hypothetical protein
VGNNVYLATLAERFAAAADLDHLWAILTDAAHRLQFDRLELRFAPGVLPEPEPAFREWEGRQEGLSDPAAVWTIPLVMDGRVVATVILTRSLKVPAYFDHGYLLNALNGTFAAKLKVVLPGSAFADLSRRLDRSSA